MHALADALAVHELRPRIEDGQVARFLLLPRRGVLGLPIRLLRTVSGTDKESSGPSSPNPNELRLRFPR